MHRSSDSPFLFLWFTSLFLSVCLVSVGYGQQPERPVVVLKGATLIDGLGNPPLADATVVVEGDTIRSIFSGQGADTPPNATLIDVTGKFIIPGLVDTHVHWEPWMGEIYMNHGVTSLLAQGDVSPETRTHSHTSLTTPRIFHTGGRPRLTPSMTREEVRQAVQVYLKKDPDVAWFFQFRENNREVFGWAAEEVHAAGLAVFSHTQDAGQAIDAGMDIAEHIWAFALPLMSPQELEDFEAGRLLHWGTYLREGPQLDQMIRKAVRQGAYLNPTLAYEWGSMSPKIRDREREIYALFSNPDLYYYPENRAEMLLLRLRLIKTYSSDYEHMPLIAKLSPEDLESVQEAYRNVQRFMKLYVEAGGKVVSGTDAPGVASPGLGMHHEMELLVEAGLTPEEALKSSTSWGAELLAGFHGARGNPRVGTLQEGNFADLLILEANPLEDIANTKKINRVMKGGEFFRFGYHPEFFTGPPGPASRAPKISAISPHKVTEGRPDLEIVIEGSGFVAHSVVKVEGVALATVFENPSKLRATIPASFIESALPDPYRMAGPDQKVGVHGDRSISVVVLNPPPSGGISNAIWLLVQAEWHTP
ncbi:MAG: amidohydrolase family protein [Acidobacteriota bacterium]